MKRQRILNKKTICILLILLIMALGAGVYNRSREAKEAEDAKISVVQEEYTTETKSGDQGIVTYHVRLQDFIIGEDVINKTKPKYGRKGVAEQDAVTESATSQPEALKVDKEKALAAARQLEVVMKEVGLAAILGSEFSAIDSLFVQEEDVLEEARLSYDGAAKKYAYKDGNGIIKVEITDVWAEVKNETSDESAMRVSVNLEYNYNATTSLKNEKTDTLETLSETGSSITKAELRWEDGAWKALFLQ